MYICTKHHSMSWLFESVSSSILVTITRLKTTAIIPICLHFKRYLECNLLTFGFHDNLGQESTGIFYSPLSRSQESTGIIYSPLNCGQESTGIIYSPLCFGQKSAGKIILLYVTVKNPLV